MAKKPQELVDEVKRADQGPRPRDVAFTIIDGVFDLESLDEVDECLRLVEVETSSTQAIVSWLTATLPIADRSEARASFYEKAKAHLEKTEPPERTLGLLRGLGPSGAQGAREAHQLINAALDQGLVRVTEITTKDEPKP
mgnify:CR=1 FL=1